MKRKLIDIIDFDRINVLLEGFNQTTGFVTAILDLEGNVLSKSGWRQICTEFHRVNPKTSKKCTISDTELAGKLAEGEKYHFYKCLNGLVDVAVPIIIKGEHIANLFSGQFFFEEPDRDFFIKQATKYGFSKTEYLKSLDDVPVIDEEKVKPVMDFLLNMTLLISEISIQKLEQIELNNAIKSSEGRWKYALEGAGDGVWDWNAQTNEVFFSDQWKAMLGYNNDEIGNTLDEWDKRIHPDDKDLVYLDLNKHLTNETPIYQNEHRVLCKDGTHKWILDRGKVISRNEDGKPLRVIGAHSDISERKKAEEEIKKLNAELEQRVQDRTSELSNSQKALLNLVEDLNDKSVEIEKSSKSLEAKNKELETFTYSVSHDLKAPLRGIDGYSQILLKEYESKLDTEGKRFLRTIRESAMQMNQLINDLLDYSRLERQTLRPSIVNLKNLIEILVVNKTSDKSFNKFKIAIHIPKIEIYADKDGLNLSLRNLIENAFKFTQKQSDPKIEIGYQDNNSKHTIFVKDNGIGFDMKFHDRIFEIFQRLHRSEEYEGTGVGLAMVRKAIERLNGKVWAESEVGKGSTFYIEIPKIQSDDNNKL